MARRSGDGAKLHAALRASEQGLLDLSEANASDVVLVRDDDGEAKAFFEALEARAHDQGFVVAGVIVGADDGFEALHDVVRAFAQSLRTKVGGARGLVALLDAAQENSGRRAVERFDEATAIWGASGELTRLARAYLIAQAEPRHEARAIRAYLEGTAPPKGLERTSLLEARTAKRALVELTRLVRALGYAGTLFIAHGGDVLPDLTPARRENAYTVLRELCDNTDGPRGMVSARLYVAGGPTLFEGTRSIRENAPLATRVLSPSDDLPSAPVALPLGSVLPLVGSGESRAVEAPGPRRARAIGGLSRASRGLPPADHLADLTVGYDAVDSTLDSLFELAAHSGSVFSLLSGAYGSGKTHLLLHVTARALSEKRPVLRLSVESLDADLGNPQRHLRRLLEGTLLPGAHAPGPLDRLAAWVRTGASKKRFTKALEEISSSGAEAAPAARRALRITEAEGDDDGMRVLSDWFGAVDLASKSNGASYRQDAYSRLLLWIELLARMDGCAGPVLLIDEAENLYKGGTSRPERRTAMRSLGFYCGGALPGACVILAVTPETLEMLRSEAEEVLDEVTDQKTLLPWEDVTMLRRRLLRARPIEVAKLAKSDMAELATRVRSLHASARGPVKDTSFAEFVADITTGKPSAREIVRATVTRLERIWWTGNA